jgi:hypothetical protein
MRQIEERAMADHGFLPDLSSSIHQNAIRVLGDTPPGYYFNSPSNLAFHDLTSDKSLPAATHTVMGLSTKFIPTPRRATERVKAIEAFERFERDLNLKVYFAGDELVELPNSKLYVKSTFCPPQPLLKIDSRLQKFELEIRKVFREKKGSRNFTTFQAKLFENLRANDSIVHALADKGLGPVAIELERYITDALKHLLDKDTYEVIPEEQALQDAEKLSSEIFEWTRKWRGNLTDMSVKYIRKKLTDSIIDPFGYFYLLYKLHKTPIKTRPVCSDCASLPHALGEWVDEMLQPLVKAQATYFKDSFALKKWLNSLTLPANSSLFTYDAVSMYTNIDTEDCIDALSDFLLSKIQTAKFTHYSPRALIEAIKIVMRNNRMRFGDIIVKQLRGIAMGMSPAPSIANLYVAIHELKSILQHVGSFIFFLRRFIDDGFGVWLHDADPLVDAANWKNCLKML